jgi:hypothetical protein
MTTETYDNKPKFDPNKPFTPVEGKPAFDPTKSFEAVDDEKVKKKEALDAYGAGLQKMGSFLGLLPSSTGGQTKLTNVITSKPIKKANPFDVQVDEKTDKKAREVVNNIMLSEDDKWKDPIKAIDEKLKSATDIKEFSVLNRAADLARKSIAGSGTTAKRILQESHLGEETNNLTTKILRNKEKKYDEAVQPIRDIAGTYGDKTFAVKNALIKKHAIENPSFDKELEAAGLSKDDELLSYPGRLPNGKVGQILSKELDDPDVLDYLQNENPDLISTFQEVHKNLLTDHPDFGANVVANKVSRAVQKSGFNNIDPIFNFYGDEHKEVANQTAKQVLNPEELAIWDAKVKDNQEDYMDAPSLAQGFAEAGKDFGKGILNTITQPFTPTSTAVKNKWEKEANNVSANPEGISKFIRDTGSTLGLVTSIGITGGASGITNPAAAGAAATALGFFGNELESGKQKYPDSPVKAWTSAIINTGFYSALAYDIFPANKVKSAFEKIRPEADEIVSKLASGKITQDAAKNELQGLGGKMVDFIGGTMTKNTRISAEMALGNAINQTFDKINMDEKTFAEHHAEGESLDVAKAAFLSNIAVAGLSKFGEIRKGNKIAEDIYYDAAANPKLYERIIDDMVVSDQSVNPVELKSNLKYLSDVKKELDEKGISRENQNRYLFESLRNRTLKGAEEKGKDDTISKQKKEEIKHSEEIMDGILEGKDPDEIVTTKDEKEAKETLKEESDKNKLIDKGNKVVDKLLEEKDENDKPLFKGVYRDIAKSDPLGFLEEIAQQAQGVDKDGKPLDGGGREKDMIPQYGADVINVAKELFPAKKQPKVSVILPNEIKRPETITIKPEESETAPDNKGVEASPEINEPAKAGETTEEPPKTDKNTEGKPYEPNFTFGEQVGGEDKIRLSHADTEKIYKEHNLPERLETPTKSDTELEAKADKLVESGYDFDKESDKVMKGEKNSFTDEEQVAFAKVVGALKEKQKGLDVKSPEFDALQDKIEKYSRASDVVGTLEGRALRARQLFVPKEESLSDYVMREKEAAKVDVLTDAQKETVAKEHDEISKLTKEYEDKIQSLKDENARIRAEAEIKKSSKASGTKKDYKKERQEIFTSIQEKLRKARGESNVTIVPYAKELFAIAPDVAKLVKSYAEQGVVELADMIKKVHSDLKEAIPDIKDTDVRDLIAGAYNEKKRTRTELAEKLRDLRDEAKYINKLDAILRGEQPKTERAKIERNKKIKDLREKIKDIQDFDKDVEAQKKATAEAKAKAKSGTESDLGKAEKEIEKSEEKEQKRLQSEAAKETKRLEREFEREKKKEERGALRQKLAEARRIEKELSFKTPEERALAAFKTRTQSQIDKIEAQIKSGDFSEPDKAPIKLDKEAQDLQDKLIKLKNERQLRLLKEEYRASSKWNKIQTEAANVLGVPRTLMASIDYSAPLRQALLPTLSHPLLASKAGLEMFKASFSQKHYDRWFSNLENSDRFKLIKDSGLGITDVNNPKLSAKEEQFMNGLAEKIPLVGRLVKGSERAYTIYINKMRVDLFNRFADNMQSRGLTFENAAPAYKQLAAYVNNMTGRGDLGKTMNEAAPVLNQLFFSPRLMASRINTLTYLAQPRFWNKVPKEARIDYFRSLVATAGIGLTVLALAKLNGAETEDDPRSPDFGKVKSGNTRWDIWGGHQQYIRLMAQMISGKKKSSTTGRISEIGTDNPYSGTRGGLGLDFLRGKLAPVPSIAVDILAGENSVGQKLTTDWIGTRKQIGLGENLANHLLPLTFTGLHDALKDQGGKAWFTVGVPSVFGVGTQTYNSGKKK